MNARKKRKLAYQSQAPEVKNYGIGFNDSYGFTSCCVEATTHKDAITKLGYVIIKQLSETTYLCKHTTRIVTGKQIGRAHV